MRGEGVRISMTDCYRETEYGEPMVGLKSFILSPFIDERDIEQLVRDILDAGRPWRPSAPESEPDVAHAMLPSFDRLWAVRGVTLEEQQRYCQVEVDGRF